MKPIKFAILLSMVCLLAGCNYLMKDYEFDSNPDALRDRNMIEYFESQWDVSTSMYCQAVRKYDLLNEVQSGNKTRIVPNNAAFTSLFQVMGVGGFDDVDSVVMRNLLLYLIADGEYRSKFMEESVNYQTSTAAGNEMYFKRKTTGTNKFKLYINDDPEKLMGGPAVVSTQDYFFKDGVAQVVGSFPYYQPFVAATDPTPSDYSVRRDTLWVVAEGHINSTSLTKNYYNNTDGMQTTGRTGQFRYGILKFQLDKSLPYKANIASATLNVTMRATENWAAGTTCALDYYELDDVSWDQRTFTFNTFGTGANNFLDGKVLAGKAEFALTAAGVLWSANPPVIITPKADILASVVRHYAKGTLPDSIAYAFIDGTAGVASSSKTTMYVCNQTLQCPPPSSYRAHIALSEAAVSAIRLVNNNALTTNNNIAAVSKAELSMQPPVSPGSYTYTDNNIIYILSVLPTNGVVAKNGIPLGLNSKFTQAEVAAGCIKYFRTGTASSDSFKVKATDYLGGVYTGTGATDGLLTIAVQ